MNDRHYRSWEPLLPARALAKGPLVLVSPHPDDEVIGAAGLILGHVEAGFAVTIVVMTDGAQGIPGTDSGPVYAELRREECRRSCEILGVKDLRFLDFADGSLRDCLDDESATGPLQQLSQILVATQATTIAMPSPFELHPDHKAAFYMAEKAVEASGLALSCIAYEVGSLMPTNVLIDLTPWQAQKMRALAAYASQIEHHDIPGKVAALDRARTANVPMPEISHCEGYLVIEPGKLAEYRCLADDLCRLIDSMMPRPPHA